ncbi:polyphosphate:AMP phosphotransferase [Lacticaseibacillus rhamnosus MTCC 5462]|nr:polyphosphate:AMP phosphotransferase [Lacticaseibacillus rhamnosus MTCC 5462]
MTALAPLTFKHLRPRRQNIFKIKEQIKADIDHNIKVLSKVQQHLAAQKQYSVLIIFQGMDAAGKDSMIEHVMSGVNPQGTSVVSFKVPTELELGHDFYGASITLSRLVAN